MATGSSPAFIAARRYMKHQRLFCTRRSGGSINATDTAELQCSSQGQPQREIQVTCVESETPSEGSGVDQKFETSTAQGRKHAWKRSSSKRQGRNLQRNADNVRLVDLQRKTEVQAGGEWVPRDSQPERRRRYGQMVEALKADAKARRDAANAGALPPLLHPPANGLLVPALVPVARRVLRSWALLMEALPALLQAVPSHACSHCPEVAVGPHPPAIRSCFGPQMQFRQRRHSWQPARPADVLPVVEAFHVADRLRSQVPHAARFSHERVPAVVELCVQAGAEVPGLQVVRHTRPVGSELIKRSQAEQGRWDAQGEAASGAEDASEEDLVWRGFVDAGTSGAMEAHLPAGSAAADSRGGAAPWTWASDADDTGQRKETATRVLQAWLEVRDGVQRLMAEYAVHSCGYCPEVHVGAAGHKVRLCDGSKQQWRQGQHGWHPAALEDVLPPATVWWSQYIGTSAPLMHELQGYYARVPAVVALCIAAGADSRMLPPLLLSALRSDVVVPDLQEVEDAI